MDNWTRLRYGMSEGVQSTSWVEAPALVVQRLREVPLRVHQLSCSLTQQSVCCCSRHLEQTRCWAVAGNEVNRCSRVQRRAWQQRQESTE